MPQNPQSADAQKRIEQEASYWLARLDGAESQQDAETFARAHAQWLASDPRHLRAWQRMNDIWQDIDLLADDFPNAAQSIKPRHAPDDAEIINFARNTHPTDTDTGKNLSAVFSGSSGQPQAHAKRRPWRVVTSSALAASIALAALFGGMYYLPRQTADLVTGYGEVRTTELPDGSVIALNTDTLIDVDYSGDARRITLISGEAVFTVSPDKTRPFIVTSGNGTATALGTVYGVRKYGENATVTVLESKVGVQCQCDNIGPDEQIVVLPGQKIQYGPSGMGKVESTALTETSWLDGKLVFRNERLDDAIAKINRYHYGIIRLANRSRADERINGVVNLDNPTAMVDTLKDAMNLDSISMTNALILLY